MGESRPSQCSVLGRGETLRCHGLWRTKFGRTVFISSGLGGRKSNVALGCVTQPGSAKGHIRNGSVCKGRTERWSSLSACKMTFMGNPAHCNMGYEDTGGHTQKHVCGCQGTPCPGRSRAESPVSLPCQLWERCDPGLFESLLHWR